MLDFASIYRAYRDCARTKRATHNAIRFEMNQTEHLVDLEHALQSRTYRPGRSICFIAHAPKMREIFAADFKDRVVHHLLINAIEPWYDRKFIHDVYNNRKGKGIHAAVQRAQHFARRYPYFLQLDIKNFFYSLDKNILFRRFFADVQRQCAKVGSAHHCDADACDTLSSGGDRHFAAPVGTAHLTKPRRVGDNPPQNHGTSGKTIFGDITSGGGLSPTLQKEAILYLANRIIYHDPTRRAIIKGSRAQFDALPPHKSLFHLPKHIGLPIGNLTSQFFANVYLNPFDHFVKRTLKAKGYLRYVDDFVLFSDDPAQLAQWRDHIAWYLHDHLGLRLRDAGILRPVGEGIDFLGYIVRPDYLLVRRRVVNRFRQQKARYLDRYEALEGKMRRDEIERFAAVRASFAAHAKHADAFHLIQKLGALDENDPFIYDRE